MKTMKPVPTHWFLRFCAFFVVLHSIALSSGYAGALPGATSEIRGRAIYEAKCSACHSVDENRVGPKHMGVFGRNAGGVKDYEYSEALSQSRLIWTRANLLLWLTEPEKLIPGQKMGYRLGLVQERVDVVQFLSTLKP